MTTHSRSILTIKHLKVLLTAQHPARNNIASKFIPILWSKQPRSLSGNPITRFRGPH
jgi:hypothetical protein